jgi:hypothetical protein
MNKLLPAIVAAALVATVAAPGTASAAFVLDTGTPTGAGMPAALDATDFSAAEFNISAASTITGIQAFLTAGMDQPGATFTLAIYSDSAGFIGNRFATPVFATQGTYSADGWNGVSGLNFTASAGNYWAALEVGGSDNAIGLALPPPASGGTAPALAFAYNSGSGYTTAGALPVGLQIRATPVPLPAALWLLGSGLVGLGSLSGRRRAARAAAR